MRLLQIEYQQPDVASFLRTNTDFKMINQTNGPPARVYLMIATFSERFAVNRGVPLQYSIIPLAGQPGTT